MGFSALVGVILACLVALSLAALAVLAAPISASCTSDYIMLLVKSYKTEIGKETIAIVRRYLEIEMLTRRVDIYSPLYPTLFFFSFFSDLDAFIFKSQLVGI